MGSVYQPTPQQEEGSSYRPFIIAAVIIVLIGVGLWLYSRNATPPTSNEMAEAPYASNLAISDLKLATAKNFVGAEVTYLEGKIANKGDKTLTAAQVQCIFRNSLGEIVDRPVVPLHVEATTIGGTEFVPLKQSPLTPNQQRGFRLTFEHVSGDWNMGFPELRVVNATTK